MVPLLPFRDSCAALAGSAAMAVGGLGGLCSSDGWTYGALWRIDCRDQRLLVLEESYYEEQSANVLGKMINQVHVIGQGTIGQVAISGKHRWISFETNWMESSETSTSVHPDMFQGSAEWQHQILAGIKTIAVISLPPFGVIQFGSTQKISESSRFIARAQHLLRQLGTKQHGDAHVDLKFSRPQATFAYVSSQDAYNFKNNISSHNGVCNQTHDNHLSSECSSLSSGLLSLGSQMGTRSEASIRKPRVSSIPVASTSSGFSYGLAYPVYEIPSFSSTTSYQVTNEQAALTPTFLPPNNGELNSNLSCPSNSFTSYFTSNGTWSKENDSLSVMEHKLFQGMAIPGVFRMTPTSPSSIPHIDASHFLCENLAISNRKGVSQVGDRCSMSSNSRLSLSVAEKLLGLQHCSSPPVSECSSLSKSKYSFKSPLSNLESPESFLPSPQDLNPESQTLIDTNNDPTNHHIHDKSMNNQIHSCEKTNYQSSNSNAVPCGYDFSDVRSSCAGMDGTVDIACTATVALPNTLTERVAECVATSLNRRGNWTESTSDSTARLVSDNDILFDGMELDLNPMILRQECWDDIVLPVVCNSCPDLSASLLGCISEVEMGTVAGSGKELFTDSSFQQLLDAVVAGNANLSTSCSNSVRTNLNSAASQDSSHHTPTITKPSDAQINHIPVVGLSSHIQEAAVSLPECDKEKVMQGSSKDAQPTSHVHAWIADSCSVNDGGSALDQLKKPEETTKIVRKRARPGESARPRPKDRQQIQDRVKELREIVPNSEKCSIDALLDHTIKHMIFLQSVTKYADKLKQADELKMIGEENGVVLKDNTNGGVGGATWAYEVAGQTMVCPILVEDVHPSGQMIVEMLCEERGLFLEIADVVRGFGLTILKGVMENRERKVWARFLVEASRDVTRMDIFLSLVQLLQQTSSTRSSELQAKPSSHVLFMSSPVTLYSS